MGRKKENLKSEDSEGRYEVERIISMKTDKNGDIFYMIKWKGYSLNHCTWQPLSNLSGMKKTVNRYHKAILKGIHKNNQIIGIKNQKQKLWSKQLGSKSEISNHQKDSLSDRQITSPKFTMASGSYSLNQHQDYFDILSDKTTNTVFKQTPRIQKIEYMTENFQFCVTYQSKQSKILSKQEVSNNCPQLYIKFLEERLVFL